MAARPIWRGHLRLALVSCPVALFNARHDRAGIRFNLINPDTGNRIRMVTQDAETGKELQRRDLVKGYKFRKDQYLLLSDDDLDSVKVEISVVLGRSVIPMHQLLRMGRGAVIELDSHQEDPVLILANDRPVAKGEIVIHGDRIGVSITEILRAYQ